MDWCVVNTLFSFLSWWMSDCKYVAPFTGEQLWAQLWRLSAKSLSRRLLLRRRNQRRQLSAACSPGDHREEHQSRPCHQRSSICSRAVCRYIYEWNVEKQYQNNILKRIWAFRWLLRVNILSDPKCQMIFWSFNSSTDPPLIRSLNFFMLTYWYWRMVYESTDRSQRVEKFFPTLHTVNGVAALASS